MIGVCADALVAGGSASAVSKPSMSGMLTSSRITANSRCSTSRSASVPERTNTRFWPQLLEHGLEDQQLLRQVVDDQDARPCRRHRSSRRVVELARSAAQPAPQHGQQVRRVDRLGQVVPGAGLDALLAVALHRLGRHRDHRQLACRAAACGSRASSSMPSISGIMMSISTMSIAGSLSHQADRIAAVVGRDDHHALRRRARWPARRCCACRRRRSAPSCRRSARVRVVHGLDRARARGPTSRPGCGAARTPSASSSVSSESRLAQRERAVPRVASRRRAVAAVAVQHDRQLADAARARPSRRARPRGRSRPARRRRPRSRRRAQRGAARRRRCRRPRRRRRCPALRAAASRSGDGGITTTSRLTGRSTVARRAGASAASTTSADCSGLARKPIAPACSARSRASSVETTQIGMWRVDEVGLQAVEDAPALHVGQVDVERDHRRAGTRASASARRRRCVLTRPLKPPARAASSSTLAKARSFSTISSTRSPVRDRRRGRRRRRWRTSSAARRRRRLDSSARTPAPRGAAPAGGGIALAGARAGSRRRRPAARRAGAALRAGL